MSWILDRRFQNCDDDELMQLIEQLDFLCDSGYEAASPRERARLLRRREQAKQEFAVRGVQITLFDEWPSGEGQ